MESRPTLQPFEPDASRVLTDLAKLISSDIDVRDVQRLVVAKAVEALGGTAGSVMMPASLDVTTQPAASPDSRVAKAVPAAPASRRGKAVAAAPASRRGKALPATKPAGSLGGMRVVAAIGRPEADSSESRPESPVAEWVVCHDQPVLLIGRSGPLAHLLLREDIRDAVCVPLRYAGRPIGALSVNNSRERPPFSDKDVTLLTAIGHLAAVALQNTRLYDEARDHQRRLQSVLRQLWTAQEDERRSLAADLHDGPAQGLFHMVFRLQTARRLVVNDPGAAERDLAVTEQAARETLAQVRAIMAGLRPMSLDDLGLVPALRTECEAITARGRVTMEIKVSGTPRRMGPEMETGLFRLVREALSNVERHSGSERARLEVRFGGTGFTVLVEDWGKGFDPEEAHAARQAGRIGLAALQERAEALGVTLEVTSEIGRGTRISLHCPWKDDMATQPSAAQPSEADASEARAGSRGIVSPGSN